MDKKKITLSVPTSVDDNLSKIAKQNGMTKSGLVTFLVNQLAEQDGNLYKNKWKAVKSIKKKVRPLPKILT